MNDTTSTEIQIKLATETEDDEVEQRLAAIAAALAEKQDQVPVEHVLPGGMACPVDPAERAACDACQ